jgi:hypothetical protein
MFFFIPFIGFRLTVEREREKSKAKVDGISSKPMINLSSEPFFHPLHSPHSSLPTRPCKGCKSKNIFQPPTQRCVSICMKWSKERRIKINKRLEQKSFRLVCHCDPIMGWSSVFSFFAFFPSIPPVLSVKFNRVNIKNHDFILCGPPSPNFCLSCPILSHRLRGEKRIQSKNK